MSSPPPSPDDMPDLAKLSKYLDMVQLGSPGREDRIGWKEEMKTTPLFSWPVKRLLAAPALTVPPPAGTSSESIAFSEIGSQDDHVPATEIALPSTPTNEAQIHHGLRDDRADDGLDAQDESSTKPDSYSQYAILGTELSTSQRLEKLPYEAAVFLNTNTPWSAFLCGSQGSGKSHTLSCILENCLLKSNDIGETPQPLSGMVFAYDKHSSGIACEAAHLATHIPVKVLVSPSSYRQMKVLYEGLPGTAGRIKVYPLLFNQKHLDTSRMMKMMAFSPDNGPVPLYMEVIYSILKEMAVTAKRGHGFNYRLFRDHIKGSNFQVTQQGPLAMRLALLDTYMDCGEFAKHFPTNQEDIFKAESGSLTIVDLTDPFVDPSSACVLFDMCLALFLEDRSGLGKVIALDEAHKFMNEGSSDGLTDSLLTVIREQRHKGARVVIATQEPTISPKLLDLCTMTFVHRFTSPDWLNTVRAHLAGASGHATETDGGAKTGLFDQIVGLNVGESLLFSPNAVLDVAEGLPKKLGTAYLKFKTRRRITSDGGKSVMAI